MGGTPRDDLVRRGWQQENSEDRHGAVNVDRVPARFGNCVGEHNAGLLLDLARDVAGDVAASIDDIFRLERAAGL